MSKVIDKVKEQEKRVRNFSNEMGNYVISKTDDYNYIVLNLTNLKAYKVNTAENTCDCPDYIYRCKDQGISCKHLIAALANEERKEKEERVLKAVSRW